MSRPRPPSPDCIKDIKDRIELLLKCGPITKDLMINSEEASAITGLSQETIRKYGTLGYFSTIKYPHRNLYPASELCEYVLKRYHKAKDFTSTTELSNSVRRGRPRKQGVKK